MKFLFFSLLLFFSFVGTAQADTIIKISSVKLHPKSKLNSVKDLVPNLKDCTIEAFKLTFSYRGSVKEFPTQSEFFSAETRQIIGSLNVGQKFFIEDLKSNCSTKKSYTLQVK